MFNTTSQLHWNWGCTSQPQLIVLLFSTAYNQCIDYFPGPPSPPVELHVTDASRHHIAIVWKPPVKNGGSPITGYHIELSEAGTDKWMRVNSRPVKELKYRAEEGIIPEKQYVVRVRAINCCGR